MANDIFADDDDVKTEKGKILDKSIDLKFNLNPRKVLKFSLIVLLLLGIFFLGRFSADGSMGFLGITGASSTADEALAEEPAVKEPVVEETVKEAPKEEEVKKEEPVKEEVKVAEKEESSGPEKIINSDYSSITLGIEKVGYKWMDTWGRITSLEVLISNDEDGTIKPDKIMMVVKGYEYEKEVPLPFTLKSITKGKALSTVIDVPGGFPYASPDAGKDLNAVHITFSLFDKKGKLMDQIAGTHDLED